MAQANLFRSIFFLDDLFAIGVLSNFRKLWQEGHRQVSRGLCALPVRIHHLGRPLDLVAVLPRSVAARY